MARFATLLGTYSLNENDLVISLRHTQPNDKKAEFSQQHGQLEKLLIASSCNALRGMISCQSRDVSSFPALVLNSFGWGQVAPDMAQKQQVASFLVGRPIVFLPRRRVEIQESSVENGTTPDCRPQNCEKDDDEYDDDKTEAETDAEGRKRAALDSDRTVGIKRHRIDHKSKLQLEDDSDLSTAIQSVEDIARVPYLMMSNFSSSFALLIEARLRAYGNILKRHIATFSHDSLLSHSSNGIPQHDEIGVDKACLISHDGCPMTTQIKLNTLVAIGEHMEVNGVVTTFHVQKDAVLFPTNWRDVKSVDDNILILPITFEAIVDLSIPVYRRNEWQSDKVTVSMQTSGSITGEKLNQNCTPSQPHSFQFIYFHKSHFVYSFLLGNEGCYEEDSHTLFTQTHVQLDTSTLVSQMINKACDVVLQATQNVNAAISELKGAQSSSQQDEDQVDSQPRGKSSPCSTAQLTDYKPALPTQQYTMVTPEFKPKATKLMPCEFALDGAEKTPITKDGVDKDCAAIIDYAIGNFSS